MICFKYLIFLCVAYVLWINTVNAQTTPEELGKYFFNSFQQDSTGKIEKLVPTLDEMKLLGDKLEIKRDSKQFTEAIEGYQGELDKLHENLKRVFSDTLKNGLHWQLAQLKKINKTEETIPLDSRDAFSKLITLTKVKIYFSSNAKSFVIILNDVFQIGELWKIGNSIYLEKIE